MGFLHIFEQFEIHFSLSFIYRFSSHVLMLSTK